MSFEKPDYFLKSSGSEYEIYFLLTINLQENRLKKFGISFITANIPKHFGFSKSNMHFFSLFFLSEFEYFELLL